MPSIFSFWEKDEWIHFLWLCFVPGTFKAWNGWAIFECNFFAMTFTHVWFWRLAFKSSVFQLLQPESPTVVRRKNSLPDSPLPAWPSDLVRIISIINIFRFLLSRIDREGKKWKRDLFFCRDLPAPLLGSLHARGLWVSTWGSLCLTAQCPFIDYIQSFESNQRCLG